MCYINFTKKRGQAGTEYLILIGFITFAIMSVLALAYVYSDSIKDQLVLNQVENFANNLINSAESVYFSGEPSKIVVNLYLPDRVENISIIYDSLVISTITSNGINVRAYESRVPLEGSLSSGFGTRKITLSATDDYVSVSG